ncbi:hypothetical protein DFH06DRAFT_1471444 [Mycena polygramma]|nr:hypothetical protein DFH06DRAFT_1471444 [Mycena polygramma]
MSESFLPVLLAIFLFFLIPLTFCVAILLVMGPKRQSLFRAPHAPSAPATRASVGVTSTWNNPLDAVREGATISSWLQVPPNVLQQMGRSLSTSPQRLPNDAEAGIHLSEFYIGVGHLNPLPVGTYRTHS